jgi:hypothetical protein
MNVLAYTPFLQPIPYLWDAWIWLLFPLCLGVSVVYKSIKCRDMKAVPIQALLITFYILLSIAAAGAALAGVVRALEY